MRWLRIVGASIVIAALVASAWFVVRGEVPSFADATPSANGPLRQVVPWMLEPTPEQLALENSDKTLASRVLSTAHRRAVPYVVAGSPGIRLPILVVPFRASTYTLTDLMHASPHSFHRMGDGRVIVLHSILIARGATVIIDSASTSALLLQSSPRGYAFIEAAYSRLVLRGRPGHPFTVSSFDASSKEVDENQQDGRSYVQTHGGSLELSYVDARYLGFPSIGSTSGVAWIGTTQQVASGGARFSQFRRNLFGAYTAQSDGLVFDHASFSGNDVYGFDGHTVTVRTSITSSTAFDNGKHGFVFSDACDENLMQDDTAFRNGRDGVLIDDGKQGHAVARPSSGNVVSQVTSYDNGRVGIVIEGGTGNRISRSVVTGNAVGISVRGPAIDSIISRNRIDDSQSTGVRLDAPATGTIVRGNKVSSVVTGISAATTTAVAIRDNEVDGATTTSIRLEGDQSALAIVSNAATGLGKTALDVRGASGVHNTATAVDDSGWQRTTTTDGALDRDVSLVLRGVIIGLPLVAGILVALRRLRHTQPPPHLQEVSSNP